MDLTGKIALVTGGAHGIGEATCRRLAEAGATVVVADVDSDHGTRLAAALGPPHRFVRLDVSDEENWSAALDEVKREFGGLHILFLNAGVLIRPIGAPAGGDAMRWLNIANYKRVSRINTDGVFFGAILGFPVIRESGGGIIIATISTAAVDHYEGDPAYSASKAGILAMVRSLASEFDRGGVRICAIGPGSVDTRIYPRQRRLQRKDAGQSVPASPFYLANAVLAIIDRARSGDIWFARPDDQGFFVFDPPSLPSAPISDDAKSTLRFVPASIDGEREL